jgi:hypothetical protein
MDNSVNGDKAYDLEPWANDVCLKDVLEMGTVNRTVRLILKLVETMEKTPITTMSKTESIPMLWERVKELKPKNFEDLIHTCHDHGTYKMSVEKLEEEAILRAKIAREDTEREEKEKKARDKRSEEEINSTDENEPSSQKERKCFSLGFDTVNDEGTCVIPSLSCMSLCPLWCTHVFLFLLCLKQLHILSLDTPTWMDMSLTTLLNTTTVVCVFY